MVDNAADMPGSDPRAIAGWALDNIAPVKAATGACSSCRLPLGNCGAPRDRTCGDQYYRQDECLAAGGGHRHRDPWQTTSRCSKAGAGETGAPASGRRTSVWRPAGRMRSGAIMICQAGPPHHTGDITPAAPQAYFVKTATLFILCRRNALPMVQHATGSVRPDTCRIEAWNAATVSVGRKPNLDSRSGEPTGMAETRGRSADWNRRSCLPAGSRQPGAGFAGGGIAPTT